MPERRAFPRIKKRLEVDFVGKGRRAVGVTDDMSVTGLFILSTERPVPGEEITIEVKAPNNERFHLKGRVVRAQPASEPQSTLFPIAFGLTLSSYNESYDRFLASLSNLARANAVRRDPSDVHRVRKNVVVKMSVAPATPSLDAGLVRMLLVAESEQTFRVLSGVVSHMEFGSFKLEWAQRGREALATLAEKRHEVCLVSWRFGTRPDHPFIQEALEAGCEVPLIELLPHRDRALELQAIGEGAADALDLSQLDPERLDRAIRHSLAHARAKAALRRSERELSELYDDAPCGYLSLDAGGMFVRINETALSWLAYSREELVGVRRFTELLSPASSTTYFERTPLLLARGQLRNLELDLVRKGGEVLHVLASATLGSATGQKPESRWTILDVSLMKRTDTALRRLHKAVDTIRLPVMITDLWGTILYVNPAAAAMSGYGVEELVGKEERMLSPPELWTTLPADDLGGRTHWQRDSRSVRKDGTVFAVRLISDLVTDSLGNPIGIVTCSGEISAAG